MIGQLLLAFISTFAFAILFSAPRSQYFACGLCGCFTWGMYLLFQKFGNSVVIAALFATFFVTVLARILSIIKKAPVTIYLVTGILPLVPGAGIYYTSYHLIMNHGRMAASMGLETFKMAGAIALGIIFGSAIPMKWIQKYRKCSQGQGYMICIFYTFFMLLFPRLSPLTCCVSCSSHTPFCACFVQLTLQAQTGTKHERQCSPHDGSLATVCGDSRETALYQYRRFSNDCKEGSTNR